MIHLWHGIKSNMTDLKVEQAIESICKLGCRKVNKVIEDLSSHKTSDLTQTFNFVQRQTILNELTDIMSVYDMPCDIRR